MAEQAATAASSVDSANASRAVSVDTADSLPENSSIRSDRKPCATVLDLPADVLLLIFNDVFKAAGPPRRRQDVENSYGITLAPWLSSDDPNPQHPSPECLASVSPAWREAMSNSSHFWTRFVIWVGRDPTPLSRIHQHLAWSRNHPLEIYIVRRFDPSMEDPTEKAQVNAAIEALLPSVKRWRVLCMKLLHSSSLPLPHIDLVGCAEQLKTLILDFVVDDSINSTEGTGPLTGEFYTPVMEQLSIGGVAFNNSYKRFLPLFAMPPKIIILSITDYDSRNAVFSLADLLTCFRSCPDLSRLQLNNLHLDCSYGGPPIYTSKPPFWQGNINFIDMDGAVIAEYGRLLGYPVVDYTSYTRCTAPSPAGAALVEAHHITMVEIDTPAALIHFFAADPQDLHCGDAWFTNCDGLTADVLRKLAQPIPAQSEVEVDDDDWLCPILQGLTIEGCKNFRSSDLRAMLEARRVCHEATGFALNGDQEFVVSSVSYLEVRGCCELEPGDKEWLHANVSTVVWDGWVGGTEHSL
ncbi:hypothetical protein EVJ58_g5305 [Rhodofomes roseus]|uniref:F-box domain-containing protein n=1 Tax=Rhodofomes roseus TaxID=34475 RepID=A0A4Y9YF49_9APHY|nr:hypothetical protein EVJ58_g5305 [Rhodofomes roseus]